MRSLVSDRSILLAKIATPILVMAKIVAESTVWMCLSNDQSEGCNANSSEGLGGICDQ